nr:FbpB family small basic protein [Neobacillus sp. Marseille-Q6967]
MRKRKISFKELLIDNKQEIQSDVKALEKIEKKIEEKHAKKLLIS